MLSFSIDKQTLIRLDNQQVVTDSYNYLYAYFNFSSDWNNVNKNAIFEINGKTYTMPILNNISLVPWEVIVVPDFTVSAYGFTTTKRITTNSISVETNSFITEPENIPQNQPTPTDYEAYVELVNEALKQINDLSVEAEQVLDQAKQYNEQSQQAATNAANSASQAEASSQSAQVSAQNAESSAQNASNSASSAQNSASEASTYAQNAKESKTKAEQYSVSAQNSASEAQQYSSSAQESAEQANQSSESAQQYASNAEASANNAAQSAETAKEYSDNVVSLGTQAVENINSAKDAAIQEITQSKDGALTDINSAQTGAISAISQAQQTAVSDITDKGTEQVSNINSAGSTAISNIQSAESESLQKIQNAQTTAIEDINNTADEKIQEIENINSLLPKPTTADAGKVVVVKPDGTGYELGDVQTDSYTKAESDARYAPIASALKVKCNGTGGGALAPTVEWWLQSLKIIGRSTQGGTPSPNSPVPIMSAGESGSITVTVSGGADQSQQLAISTPNGLPGIPVDSGGNYTDETGQQWICDEVDFARGVYVQRVERITFNGSSDELWEIFTNDRAQRNYFRIAVEKTAFRDNKVDVLLCSAFLYMQYGYAEPSGDNTACFQSDNLNFACSTSLFGNIDEWTQYLSGNAMTLIYAIATPIETPIPPEKIAAYRALHTYDGMTNIIAPDAMIQASAVADATEYINQQIANAIAIAKV